MALLGLAAGVTALLVQAGLPTTVADSARHAICRIARSGACEPGNTATPLVPPPADAAEQPGHPCYGGIDIGYAELTGTVPILRFADLRGSTRVGFQTRQIVRPGQSPQWQVQFYGWGEAAAATPGLPGAQIDADDPLGIGTGPADLAKAPAGAWAGLNAAGGSTFVFDTEKEAREFPARLLRHLVERAVADNVSANPMTNPVFRIARLLPGISGLLPGSLGDPLMARVRENSLEGGLTGGFTAKKSLLNDSRFKLGASLGGRGWQMAGARVGENGEVTLTLRSNGEVEPSVVVDAGRLVGPGVRGQSHRKVDELVGRLEELGRRRYGAPLRIPAKMRENLTKNWPDLGLTVKAKAGVTYQLTVDRNLRPVRFTKLVDSQVNLYGRLSDKAATKNDVWEGAVNHQSPEPFAWLPFGNARTLDQSSLDLKDPADAQAVAHFIDSVSRYGPAAELMPQADLLDRHFENRGAKTQLNYRSLVTNGKVSGERRGGRGLSMLEVKGESESNVLTDAQVWRPGRGWAPWAGCRP